jgi:hypothetical protein
VDLYIESEQFADLVSILTLRMTYSIAPATAGTPLAQRRRLQQMQVAGQTNGTVCVERSYLLDSNFATDRLLVRCASGVPFICFLQLFAEQNCTQVSRLLWASRHVTSTCLCDRTCHSVEFYATSFTPYTKKLHFFQGKFHILYMKSFTAFL